MMIFFVLTSVLFAAFLPSDVLAASNKTFPENFKFGVSTSAYQIEGAWNVSGKGLSMWDVFFNKVQLFDSGNVACDSYHKMDEDVAMLKNLGVNFYRFSIAWTRIMPNGTSDHLNIQGILHYYWFIRKLKDAGIEPMITMYHFDLPAVFMNGIKEFKTVGWVDDKLVDHFVNYAKLLFIIYGDLVKHWITINEPKMVCVDIINDYSIIPGIDTYKCIHNIIRAHAKVYRLYEKEFKEKQGGDNICISMGECSISVVYFRTSQFHQNYEFHDVSINICYDLTCFRFSASSPGKISISLNTDWIEPASTSTEDVQAAERALMFYFGIFAHPLVFGDYPKVVKDKLHQCNPLIRRLPQFTAEESELIKGTLDFIGVNHYTTSLAQYNHTKCFSITSDFYKDMGAKIYQDPSWEPTALQWLKVTPWGFRKLLNWIHKTYNGIEIVITENGYPDKGDLKDPSRTRYYRDYLSEALDAIHIDGVNLSSYSTWSLMDNFEWASSYSVKFGLYYVNFSSPARERYAKHSTDYFKKIVATKCLTDACDS